jgi:glycosyltransferase involved in cell wall biosynthesis
MRILLINKFHYLKGGSERCYFDTARILTDYGHEVAFFAMAHPENIPSPWSKYFVEEADYLQSQGGLFRKIKLAGKIIYNFQAQKNLEKLIKEFKPEVAHLHNIYHQLSPSIIRTLKKNKIPMAITLHDYKLVCPNYNLLARGKIWEKSRPAKYYKCFFDRCVKDSYVKSLVCVLEAYFHKFLKIYDQVDAFISPSRFLIEKFKEFDFEKEIKYLPNPLLFDSSEKAGERKNHNYILYFGRLSEEKGVDDLIRAYSLLKIDSKLIIAGAGPQADSLKKLAAEKGLKEKIVFVGHQKEEALWNLVKRANFIVVPSRWYENAPYNVSEAMALTKVVICAKIGGLSEIIRDRENGFLFEPGDIGELAEKMRKILSLPEEAKNKIGERARQTIEEKNNKENYYNNLKNIYEEISSKH